jgi:hypothetical protein
MCLAKIDSELAFLQDIIAMPSNNTYNTIYNGAMRRRNNTNGIIISNGSYMADLKRPQRRHHKSEYFTAEWACAVAFLTASLLLLPLFLPPLPPPPFLLLIVPVVIMVLLVFLAFTPSDVRNIASSYL